MASLPESQIAHHRSKIYRGRLEADGAFRFEAVAPGRYELVVQGMEDAMDPGASSSVFASSNLDLRGPVRVAGRFP